MKILILKPSSLGDVIQALPVLRLLRLHFPKSEIYWWIDSNLSPLLEGDPDLTGTFKFYRRRWSSPLHWNEMLGSILKMRRQQFDWVIDLQGLARSGAFAWLANGELTFGVGDSREGAPGFYDLAVPRPSFDTHAVDWYLDVIKSLGVPVHNNFVWLPPNVEIRNALQQKCAIDQSRWIIINPGARWMNKRWPVEYFAELVKLLAAQNSKFRFVILGSKEDCHLGEQIARAEPQRAVDLTNQTSLSEMIEWIRLSELIVTNDTGPMHVAAALGKPVVALFGPTNPNRTGPYGQIARALRISLPCSPCLKDTCAYEKPMECLRAITPPLVEREIHRRLQIGS
ncbi:MAG: lipopolysaccharide heptosyltransferase II [Verrucomicrobiota bacterium]